MRRFYCGGNVGSSPYYVWNKTALEASAIAPNIASRLQLAGKSWLVLFLDVEVILLNYSLHNKIEQKTIEYYLIFGTSWRKN